MDSSTGASGSNSAGDGITGGYTGDSLALRIVIASFCTLAWYNALELNILIFVTFKKYSGLYFWSLLIASWGIIPYAMGFLFKFFQIISNDFLSISLVTVGWWTMVTGQAVVLYSRLHLVVRNPKVLTRILWMIIVNAIILHTPTTVLTFGSNGTIHTRGFVHGYNVMEKIQMTGFCIQEFIISGIYLWETMNILRIVNQEQTRKTMIQLIYINVIIILMDLGLLGVEYANLYILETSIKGVVYSVKLKLEFAILGKLVQFVTHGPNQSSGVDAPSVPHFVDASRTSDVTHDPSKPRQSSKPSWINFDEISDPRFEHLERKSEDSDAMRIRTERFESLKGRNIDASGSEDDIEKMMRKYSVKKEK
jgi:hypothetical protein